MGRKEEAATALAGAPCPPARRSQPAGRARSPLKARAAGGTGRGSRLPSARRRPAGPSAAAVSGSGWGKGALRSGPGGARRSPGDGEWQLLGVASGGGGGTSAERELGPLSDGGREEAPERLALRGWVCGLWPAGLELRAVRAGGKERRGKEPRACGRRRAAAWLRRVPPLVPSLALPLRRFPAGPWAPPGSVRGDAVPRLRGRGEGAEEGPV